MSEKPEECTRCQTETYELTDYSHHRPEQERWLCCYCEMALESNPVAAMAAMFHVLERRLLLAQEGGK